jgi:hypothetical protein
MAGLFQVGAHRVRVDEIAHVLTYAANGSARAEVTLRCGRYFRLSGDEVDPLIERLDREDERLSERWTTATLSDGARQYLPAARPPGVAPDPNPSPVDYGRITEDV